MRKKTAITLAIMTSAAIGLFLPLINSSISQDTIVLQNVEPIIWDGTGEGPRNYETSRKGIKFNDEYGVPGLAYDSLLFDHAKDGDTLVSKHRFTSTGIEFLMHTLFYAIVARPLAGDRHWQEDERQLIFGHDEVKYELHPVTP